MTNQLYPRGREGFLNGDVSWRDDAIKAVLIDTADYTFATMHDFLDDIPIAARVATSAALTGKTGTDGTARAGNVVFTTPTGDPCEALVLYQDTGTVATSRLLAYIDSANGLPVILNGTDATVAWHADGIFTL